MQRLKKLLGLEQYVSTLDQFLIDFDQKNPRCSPYQLKEKTKHDRLFYLRDHAEELITPPSIWDKF